MFENSPSIFCIFTSDFFLFSRQCGKVSLSDAKWRFPFFPPPKPKKKKARKSPAFFRKTFCYFSRLSVRLPAFSSPVPQWRVKQAWTQREGRKEKQTQEESPQETNEKSRRCGKGKKKSEENLLAFAFIRSEKRAGKRPSEKRSNSFFVLFCGFIFGELWKLMGEEARFLFFPSFHRGRIVLLRMPRSRRKLIFPRWFLSFLEASFYTAVKAEWVTEGWSLEPHSPNFCHSKKKVKKKDGWARQEKESGKKEEILKLDSRPKLEGKI